MSLAARIEANKKSQVLAAHPDLKRCTCVLFFAAMASGVHERTCPLNAKPVKDYTHG
jgi:hypothetical protein